MEKELKKRMWKPEEDMLLKTYIEIHGEGNWSAVSKKLGLQRGGKSCRLRWKNYLRPDIKHGSMSKDEEDLIIRMHKLIGNRWSLIAGRLPGRTDNEVKNYWNTHLSKKENSPKLKRKAIEGDDDKHESSSQKKLKMEEYHNHGSTQEENKEETRIINEEDSNSWMNNLTAVQLVADSHARNYDTTGNLGIGRDFGEFLICGQEQLAWDHATYVLFDAYGVNWEDTLPPS